MIKTVWVDLAALFVSGPRGELVLSADVPSAMERWQAMGLDVVGATTDVQRYEPLAARFFGEGLPVIGRPLAEWRQTQTWLDLAQMNNKLPEQIVFVASAPMLMGFARSSGLKTVGVMRDEHTMAVLEGVWVNELSAIPWDDLGVN